MFGGYKEAPFKTIEHETVVSFGKEAAHNVELIENWEENQEILKKLQSVIIFRRFCHCTKARVIGKTMSIN